MFASPRELKNIFNELSEPRFSDINVQWLRDQYDLIDHPVAYKICDLLTSLNHFLNSTTTNPYFISMREKAPIDEKIFNNITESLKRFSQSTEGGNENEKFISSTAVNFSLQVIANRVKELEQCDKRLYLLFNDNNELKSMLHEMNTKSFTLK